MTDAAVTPPRRPVHTYSIVARDAATGDLGCAVQSHWFNVGAIVLWAEPGSGRLRRRASPSRPMGRADWSGCATGLTPVPRSES